MRLIGRGLEGGGLGWFEAGVGLELEVSCKLFVVRFRVAVEGLKFLWNLGLESLILASNNLERPIASEMVLGLWTASSCWMSVVRPEM